METTAKERKLVVALIEAVAEHSFANRAQWPGDNAAKFEKVYFHEKRDAEAAKIRQTAKDLFGITQYIPL